MLSADGNYVVFDSLANNLDPNDTDMAPYDNYQVYEGNVQTGAIKLVSTDVAGTGAGIDGTSVFPSVSANGRYVAFQSDSQELVSTQVQGGSIQDVYVREMTKSSPTLVSIDTAGNRRRRQQLVPARDQRQWCRRRVLQPGQQPDDQRQMATK